MPSATCSPWLAPQRQSDELALHGHLAAPQTEIVGEVGAAVVVVTVFARHNKVMDRTNRVAEPEGLNGCWYSPEDHAASNRR